MVFFWGFDVGTDFASPKNVFCDEDWSHLAKLACFIEKVKFKFFIFWDWVGVTDSRSAFRNHISFVLFAVYEGVDGFVSDENLLVTLWDAFCLWVLFIGKYLFRLIGFPYLALYVLHYFNLDYFKKLTRLVVSVVFDQFLFIAKFLGICCCE